MDFKLNVYNDDGSVRKTFEKHDIRISTGICEDVLRYVDFEKLVSLDTSNDAEVLSMVGGLMKMRGQYEGIVRRVFTDMSAEDYRDTDMQEVSGLIWDIVQYAITQMMGIGSKNQKG